MNPFEFYYNGEQVFVCKKDGTHLYNNIMQRYDEENLRSEYQCMGFFTIVKEETLENMFGKDYANILKEKFYQWFICKENGYFYKKGSTHIDDINKEIDVGYEEWEVVHKLTRSVFSIS